MTFYAVAYKDWLVEPAVYRYPDRPSAMAGIQALPEDLSARIVGSEEDLDREFPAKSLLELYNALGQDQTERFSDRAAGLRRTLNRIAEQATPGPNPEPKVVTKRKEAKVATEGTTHRGRGATYTSDMIIYVLADKNPKRPGTATFERFKLYRTGMTVGEFIKAGGLNVDLIWDAAEGRKFIRIEKPATSASNEDEAEADTEQLAEAAAE